jgi:hypothetical protein
MRRQIAPGWDGVRVSRLRVRNRQATHPVFWRKLGQVFQSCIFAFERFEPTRRLADSAVEHTEVIGIFLRME